MKKGILVFTAIMSIGLIGCSGEKNQAEQTSVKYESYAKAGSFSLPKDALDFVSEQGGKELTADQIKQITDNWVETALLAEAALKDKLDQDRNYQWQIDQARMNVLAQLKIQQIRDRIKNSTGEEDIKKFYDENPQMFQKPGQVHLRHIVVPLKSDASSEERDMAKKEIDRIYGEVSSPAADFAALADKYNPPGTSIGSGGELNWIPLQRMGDLTPMLSALGIGEISKPTEGPMGYHIFQVLGKNVQGLDEVYDQIQDQIVRKKLQEEVQNLVEELKKSVSIEVAG